MTSVPLKPQYGPTLGRLLEPRWRALRPVARAVLALSAIGLLALLVGMVLTLMNATYSHGGAMPFSFEYKGLHRTTPNPGGYVKVTRGSPNTQQDSFAVAPLRLSPYGGSVTGELPLLATGYTRELSHRFSHFKLEGEGKTRISSTLSGYQVLFTALVDNRLTYGRDVMLLPHPQGARQGVVVEMLSTAQATVSKPVASSGVLETPLKTFAFG